VCRSSVSSGRDVCRCLDTADVDRRAGPAASSGRKRAGVDLGCSVLPGSPGRRTAATHPSSCLGSDCPAAISSLAPSQGRSGHKVRNPVGNPKGRARGRARRDV
jgi:hypothetical protein